MSGGCARKGLCERHPPPLTSNSCAPSAPALLSTHHIHARQRLPLPSGGCAHTRQPRPTQAKYPKSNNLHQKPAAVLEARQASSTQHQSPARPSWLWGNDLLTILQGYRTTCARSHLYTKALGRTPADHATWQENQRRPLTPSHDGQEIRNCSQAPWQHRPAHTLAPSQMAAGQCLAPQVHGNGRKPRCVNTDGTDNHTAHRASRLQNQRN